MMKPLFKQLTIILSALVVVGLLPVSAYAAEGIQTSNAGFCAALDRVGSKVDISIGERELRLAAARKDREAKLNEHFAERDMMRTANDDTWTNEREAWSTKLASLASTSAQESAVQKFITAIDVADKLRKAAVDLAISTYRTGVDKESADRQALVNGAISTFKTDTSAALMKARNDCASSSADQEAIRAAYVSAMRIAREKLPKTVKLLENRADVLKPLAEARNAAVEKAINDFKNAVVKAKLELKKSLK